MKKFNVTGTCIASENYMIDISERIEKIVQMVEKRNYFTINRARQYGKTTTLSLLKKRLDKEYICVRISFEGIGQMSFSSESTFCNQFKKVLGKAFKFTPLDKQEIEKWNLPNIDNFVDLSEHITELCEDKKIVLLIDEIDKASDYYIFLEFLGMLRDKFLLRRDDLDYTFHSVILAGVHDIKNIKDKMFRDGKHMQSVGEGNYNSPWNIAVDFDIDMSFNVVDISTMLNEYERDHNTGMNVLDISQEIYNYTGGYPFLVSRLCKHIDEKIERCWTTKGVIDAVKLTLLEDNTLFDDLFKNIENNRNLYDLIYDMLIIGRKRTYSNDTPQLN